MTETFPRLIAIHAPYAGSGKTTVAEILVKDFGYTRVPFAEPVRSMAVNLLQSLGYTESEARLLFTDPKLKETAIPHLGVTPRCILQTLATDWGRNMISKSLWLLAWEQSIANLKPPFVIDDLRFPSELSFIQCIPDHCTWWIDRRSAKLSFERSAHRRIKNPALRWFYEYFNISPKLHSSERPLNRHHFDVVLHNNESLTKLSDTVALALRIRSTVSFKLNNPPSDY